MLHYVPTGRDELANHKWLWVDVSDGTRIMFLDEEDGVALPECVVAALAVNVLKHPARAS